MPNDIITILMPLAPAKYGNLLAAPPSDIQKSTVHVP